MVGDPKAIKLWPKAEKVIKKNIADFYKEDIMIKKKLNIERNKVLMMMGKYGKKLSVNEGTLTEGKFKMKGKYLYIR
jgi:Ni,Fe-hydrogenase I small subunit